MNEYLLEVNRVSKVFRIGSMLSRKKMLAVDEVSFAIEKGKPVILSIVGESGCGKSTLCKMILRLHHLDGGDIVLDGHSYKNHRDYSMQQLFHDVQPIFQNPFEAFSMRKTVDNYLFSTALRLGMAKDNAQAQQVVDEALKSVGLSLEVVKGKYASQFSGGELQRVSIARALITKPKIIVADEPVAMIDASMKMNIVNLFKRLKETYGISFIYITHDLSTAYYVSDYIATLYRGTLIEYGTSRQIMDRPAHPYTRLLMDSIPRIGDKWTDEVAMPDIESREYLLGGCKFAPRCDYATEECHKSRPEMRNLGDHRRVLCFHPLVRE
ncbi:MAG: ABC transporter ATP-binding protein [Christensenellales bacterium]|jgi:oligopeptide/dipeptide ABC transporter ATP-binding protein